jgi:hypothetical protein
VPCLKIEKKMRYRVLGGKHHKTWVSLEEELPFLELYVRPPCPVMPDGYPDFSKSVDLQASTEVYRPIRWRAGTYETTVYVPRQWSDEEALYQILERL